MHHLWAMNGFLHMLTCRSSDCLRLNKAASGIVWEANIPSVGNAKYGLGLHASVPGPRESIAHNTMRTRSKRGGSARCSGDGQATAIVLLPWATTLIEALCMQQGGSAQDVKAHAEGAVGLPAEAPLAPYVPLMATDAVADAAAALLLDDVVPVQEENVVVVEAISSNAGQSPDQLCPLCLALAFAFCVNRSAKRPGSQIASLRALQRFHGTYTIPQNVLQHFQEPNAPVKHIKPQTSVPYTWRFLSHLPVMQACLWQSW